MNFVTGTGKANVEKPSTLAQHFWSFVPPGKVSKLESEHNYHIVFTTLGRM
jgi:hypothetical protein